MAQRQNSYARTDKYAVDAMQRHCRYCGGGILTAKHANARYCTEQCRRDSYRDSKQDERGLWSHEVLHPDSLWPARR